MDACLTPRARWRQRASCGCPFSGHQHATCAPPALSEGITVAPPMGLESSPPQDLESGPGTAVLVKKAGTSVRVLDERPICVGGTSETGGRSKLATVVRVEAGAKRFAAVSAHFTWDGNAPQRLRHAELLGSRASVGSAPTLAHTMLGRTLHS